MRLIIDSLIFVCRHGQWFVFACGLSLGLLCRYAFAADVKGIAVSECLQLLLDTCIYEYEGQSSPYAIFGAGLGLCQTIYAYIQACRRNPTLVTLPEVRLEA